MDFTSDNASGASEAILAALQAANTGTSPAYGSDPWTSRACEQLAEIFERPCTVFLVATGTAANALALAHLTPPWGAIFCHAASHVMDDECGAPEFFSAGAKLVGVAGAAGKITPGVLTTALARFPRGQVKTTQPAALSLSQATECGTVYSVAEIAALTQVAHAAGLGVHMDGARFANALVTLGCTAAEMTWRSGIDVLSFGATKNGAIACEAVIFFDAAKAEHFAFRRKRAGQTVSKGRYLGAQMAAYLEDDRWLASARHANAMAARLESGLRAAGCRFPFVREANEVFAILPRRINAALAAAGARFHAWDHDALAAEDRPADGEIFVRLVTSFATTDAMVDQFTETARQA